MKIFNKIKCLIGNHSYKISQENNIVVLKCLNCNKFKFGPTEDLDGNPVFIFEDGSYILGKRVSQEEFNKMRGN